MDKFDFTAISEAVNSHSADILNLLGSCQITCSIPSVSAFEEKYSIKHVPAPNKSVGDEVGPSSLELSNAFKALDKLPTCFPKSIKKPASKHPSKRNETLFVAPGLVRSSMEDIRSSIDRQFVKNRDGKPETVRSASSISFQSASRKDNFTLKPNDSILSRAVSPKSSIPSELNVEDVGFAIDRLYNGSIERNEKFEEMFKSALIDERNIQHQFKENVLELRRAFKDLEKLIPRGLEDCTPVFDTQQEQAIADFKGEIDAFVCIQENKDIYPVVDVMPDDGDLDAISKMAGKLLPI